MSRVKTALDNYKANNPTQFPSDGVELKQAASLNPFAISYLKSTEEGFKDPDGTEYNMMFNYRYAVSAGDSGYKTNSFNHDVVITQNKKCSGELAVPASGKLNYTVQYKLESGGVYCIDG